MTKWHCPVCGKPTRSTESQWLELRDLSVVQREVYNHLDGSPAHTTLDGREADARETSWLQASSN